jgi:ribosome-binding factor A
MTTYRTLKVASNIQYVITQHMREIFAFDQEMLDAIITTTRVQISADLKIANCYVVRGYHSKISQDIVLNKLNKVRHLFRKAINHALVLKYSPEIRFFYDISIDNVDRVNQILQNISSKDS